MENFREESKRNWTPASPVIKDDIKIGCLQRIADATETMAGNYIALIEERDRYMQWYRQEQSSVAMLERSISAFKGVITKLKKARK